MRWTPAETYTVKIEACGAGSAIGAISFAGTRDPVLIGQLDNFLGLVRDAGRGQGA